MSTNFRLTRTQSAIWVGQQLHPDSPMNNMAFAFHWREAVDVERMKRALGSLVAQCDSMRLRFRREGESVHQAAETTGDIDVPVYELSGEDELQSWLAERLQRVFVVESSVFDLAVLKLSEEQYVVYLNQHHLVTDGWSKAVQFDFLRRAYYGEALPTIPPFRDFVDFLDARRETPAHREAVAHWLAVAETLPEPPALFGERNPEGTTASHRVETVLSTDLMSKLDAACQEPDLRAWSVDLSRFQVFATVLFAYLHRISGQRELAIGVPAHNRARPAFRKATGLFMELFPQSVTVEPGETFGSLLARVKTESMDYLRHAKPDSSAPARGNSFNVLFNYINQAFVREEGQEITSEWLHAGHTEPGHHFKFQVFDFDGTGRLTLSFELNDAVIDPALQQWVPGQFTELLELFLNDRSTPIDKVCTCDRARLEKFGPEQSDYPVDKSIVDLFREQVRKSPEAPAVTFEDDTLSYRELDRRSDAVAGLLISEGLAPQAPVVICLERGPELLPGLLGIIKAGGAYVPIDPAYPDRRIENILEDVSGARCLTVSAHRERLTRLSGREPILLDRPLPENSGVELPEVAATDLLYILHTSGSTGRPKGVMNQHDGLVNRLSWAQETFRLDVTDSVLQKTTFCFDVSVWELFWPLLVGARVVLARPGGEKDGIYLSELMRRERITTLHFVPPMLEIFLERELHLPDLRRVLCSGEALLPGQVNAFRERLPAVELHNLYGPTEAAIDVTHWAAPASGPVTEVPIGNPVANTPIRILSGTGTDCPVGVPGELLIGGIQVARGYYNRPDLTDQKFVTLADGGRWYRSGDLARWRADGQIDFLGRIDNQLKIRGFRIEPGEIEAILTEQTDVRQAVVLPRGEQLADRFLVGYLVAGPDFDEKVALDRLAERVPAYMVPTRLLTVDELPLTNNGKLDRRALSAIPLTTISDDKPNGDFEVLIHGIWLDVLGLEAVGTKTSFFDLGGHSLTALRLVNRVNETLELELPATTVFRYPTISAQAAHAEAVMLRLLAEMNGE